MKIKTDTKLTIKPMTLTLIDNKTNNNIKQKKRTFLLLKFILESTAGGQGRIFSKVLFVNICAPLYCRNVFVNFHRTDFGE